MQNVYSAFSFTRCTGGPREGFALPDTTRWNVVIQHTSYRSYGQHE